MNETWNISSHFSDFHQSTGRPSKTNHSGLRGLRRWHHKPFHASSGFSKRLAQAKEEKKISEQRSTHSCVSEKKMDRKHHPDSWVYYEGGAPLGFVRCRLKKKKKMKNSRWAAKTYRRNLQPCAYDSRMMLIKLAWLALDMTLQQNSRPLEQSSWWTRVLPVC